MSRRIGAMMLIVIACALPVVSCGGSAAKQPETKSVPAGPRVVFPDGTAIKVEIAANDETRAQGLMYRDHLAEDAGMIFFFAQSGEYPFWMKNCLIAIDIIWIDEHKRVAHIEPNVPPCKADPCPSYPPNAQAKYVLEIAPGVAAKHHLKVGDSLRFEQLDSVVVR